MSQIKDTKASGVSEELNYFNELNNESSSLQAPATRDLMTAGIIGFGLSEGSCEGRLCDIICIDFPTQQQEVRSHFELG